MVIVVERCDWLTGLGGGYLAVLLAGCGRRMVVWEDCESTGGLVGEVGGVLTGVCARLCGQRCPEGRAVTAVAVATGDQLR
jgi:predicted site-specific integrase-resolvase